MQISKPRLILIYHFERSAVLKILYAVCDTPLTDIPAEISEYRKSKILSRHTQNDRSLAIAAAILLKKACACYGINEKDATYGENEYGKPYFISHPELRFSLTHSKSMVALAIDMDETGIDCEHSERRVTKSTALRFFSEKEVNDFENDLLTLWVTKESLCKLSGKGLALGARETELPFYSSSATIEGAFVKKFSIEGYTVAVSSRHEILSAPEKITI